MPDTSDLAELKNDLVERARAGHARYDQCLGKAEGEEPSSTIPVGSARLLAMHK